MQLLQIPAETETIRVSALHALAYCPRLYYLEEVEELYTQDAAVFAGRRLHAELEKQEDEDWEDLFLTSEELGLRGRVDALRTRDGQTIPYEHKRGRCYRDEHKQPQAWESDKLQILSYCYLIESALGINITEGRIRYHADNVLVHVPFDDEGKKLVEKAIATARQIRTSTQRPPVTENEKLCTRLIVRILGLLIMRVFGFGNFYKYLRSLKLFLEAIFCIYCWVWLLGFRVVRKMLEYGCKLYLEKV
jgi:CRISP-associated protein Cas1